MMKRSILLNIFVVGLVLVLSGCVSVGNKLDRKTKLKLADQRTQSAIAYYRAGKKKAAYQDIQQALSLNPNHSMANTYMGIMQWFTFKNYDEAEKYFRRAISSDRTNPVAQNNLGSLLCERGKINEAVRMFELASNNNLYDNRRYASENAGACLMRKPDYKAAEPHFRKALFANPYMRKSLYFMAKITYETKRLVSARGFILRYMQLMKSKAGPNSLLLAVRIESASGNRNVAASYAFKIKNKYPHSPAAQELKRLRY